MSRLLLASLTILRNLFIGITIFYFLFFLFSLSPCSQILFFCSSFCCIKLRILPVSSLSFSFVHFFLFVLFFLFYCTFYLSLLLFLFYSSYPISFFLCFISFFFLIKIVFTIHGQLLSMPFSLSLSVSIPFSFFHFLSSCP